MYRVWPDVLGTAARFCENYHISSNRKKSSDRPVHRSFRPDPVTYVTYSVSYSTGQLLYCMNELIRYDLTEATYRVNHLDN